jgi:hypothetical protein
MHDERVFSYLEPASLDRLTAQYYRTQIFVVCGVFYIIDEGTDHM